MQEPPNAPAAWSGYQLALKASGAGDRALSCVRYAASLLREQPGLLTQVDEAFEGTGARPEAVEPISRALEEVLKRDVQDSLLEMLTWRDGNAVFHRHDAAAMWPEPPEVVVDTRWVPLTTTQRLDERQARAGGPS